MLLTFGALTSGLDPFGMLGPQIVMNLPLELCVGVDLVRHFTLPTQSSDLCKGALFKDCELICISCRVYPVGRYFHGAAAITVLPRVMATAPFLPPESSSYHR